MLRSLFDRLWPLTLIYGSLILVSWQTRHYTTDLISSVLFLAATAWFAQKLVYHITQESIVDSRGKRAPYLRSWTPFNVKFLYDALWHVMNFKNAELWEKWFRETGNPKRPYTCETVTVGQRIVFTADEENVKAILATQFGEYGKGPQFRIEWKEFLGLSIFTTDGHQWHDSRQLLRPQFIKDRVSDLHTFEHHIQDLLPLLRGDHNGATVRVDDLMFRYTLDAATDFLFSSSAGSLQNDRVEFSTAFTEVQRVQSLIARAGPLRAFIPMKSFRQGLQVMEKFIDRYIDEALLLPKEELEKNTKSDDGYTFLHAIAAYTRDRQVLRDQLMAVLLAGRDTTAVTLSWLFYELSKQPRIFTKLRQEIIDTVGLSRVPTYDNLKSMKYLQHSINETLRLYPVVPFNVRVALEDTTLPVGGGPDGTEPIGIAKDTPIGYSTLVMQRRADIYPPASTGFPNHLEFVPERWENWNPKTWTYVPFNGGPRICIGQQFALTEIAYTVTRILQSFERIETKMDKHPGFRSDIVLQPATGVYAAFIASEKA